MSKKLILLTYNLRAGTDLSEYDRFMRDVDYPVFRSRPEVQRYDAYHVTQNVQGQLGFGHFDLLEVDDFDDMEKIFGHSSVAQHAEGWVERWSERGPGAPPEANFGISFCDLID